MNSNNRGTETCQCNVEPPPHRMDCPLRCPRCGEVTHMMGIMGVKRYGRVVIAAREFCMGKWRKTPKERACYIVKQ